MNRKIYRDGWLIMAVTLFGLQVVVANALSLVKSAPPERPVTGKVTSQIDGKALPGVNVIIRGTTTGTVTDAEGNFRINVPDEGAVLVFSFTGFASAEVAVANQSTINITLNPSVEALSEVVVIGYGTVKKSD
jgi:hypothetical protein